jgi:cell division GTPase FtsZ
MTVKNETMEIEKTNIIDDLPEEETQINDQEVDQSKLDELKSLMKSKKENTVTMKIVDEVNKSLNFGIVGSGQMGSRLAQTFYKLGYKAVALNTASQDLSGIELPKENKLLLQFGALHGAAKDLKIGQDSAEANRDEIINLLSDKLRDVNVLVLCTSLGGGSGAGSHSVLIDILSSTGLPVIVIAALPMSNEDAQTKKNALDTLASLSKLLQSKVISNLIVADNAKLETIYSDVSMVDFFNVGNEAIVRPLDVFNHFSARPSFDKPLDSMEWAKILTDGEGLTIYGELTVSDYEDQTAIAKAVIENHENGLLASGFNLETAKYAGVMIIANDSVWKKIPRVSIDYAISLIKESCPGHEAVFRGSYVDNTLGDTVKVYSIFSGLGLPTGRVEQLRKDVDADKVKTADRFKSRSTNLSLNTGKDESTSKADEVREKIAKGNSTFSKNFASGGKLDFRKK